MTLDGDLDAGDTTEVELDFTLTLGRRGFDRFGSDDGVSWWASGAPLLAWEPGVGWAKDAFVDLGGETASSPVMDTSVTVSAPQDLTVLMTGARAEPSAPQDGRRTWTSTEPVARDVGVAAGLLHDRAGDDARRGGRHRRRAARRRPAGRPARRMDHRRDHRPRGARRGRSRTETLTIALLPDYGGGIEYPSMIFEATPSRLVLVHEVAHQWFYGMVGNSQFRDPWLDEAFATWAEAVVDEQSAFGYEAALGMPGEVGGSMADFADDGTYFDVVYGKGGAALLAAREAAGPEAFDAAIRCYVDANAWSIATPDDVAAALADLPAAVAVLTDAEALGKDDQPR